MTTNCSIEGLPSIACNTTIVSRILGWDGTPAQLSGIPLHATLVFSSLVQQLLLLLPLLLLWYAVYNRYFHPLSHLPGPVFLGSMFPGANILSVLSDRHPYVMEELHAKYGPVVRLEPNMVSFADAAAQRTIYTAPAIRKHDEYRAFEWGVANLFSTTDPAMAKHRRHMVIPAYGSAKVLASESIIYECGAKEVTERWNRRLAAAGGEHGSLLVDMHEEAHCLAGRIMTRLIMGQVDESVVDLIKTMRISLALGYFVPDWLQCLLARWLGFTPFVNTFKLRRHLHQFIVARRQKQELQQEHNETHTHNQHDDILQAMMDTVDPVTGTPLSVDSLVSELGVQAFAAIDTSATTVMWIFDLLFAHPHALHRLEADIIAAYPDMSEPILFDGGALFQQLPYLEAVIWESMRVRTIGAGVLSRVVHSTCSSGRVVISGHAIPAGTVVGTPMHVLHHDRAVWGSDVHEFRPERMLDDETATMVSAEKRRRLTPFSLGVRACVGRQVGLTTLAINLANLIRRFEIRPVQCPYKPLTPVYVFLLCASESKLPAVITARSN
ncbi:cytochrome P450 [Ramicandelaber brevisporus]|nr:cytochrome P450 [Ramicandelaber brevisporus]